MPTTTPLERLRHLSNRLGAALRETGRCTGLGIRDALRPRLLLPSALAWLATFTLCSVAFIVWHEDVLACSLTLSLLLSFGVFSQVPALLGASSAALAPTVSNMGMINVGYLASLAPALFAAMAVFAVVLVLSPFLLYGFAMLAGMRIALKLCMMGRIRQQALQRYPDVRRRPQATAWKRVLGNLLHWANLAGCVLLCLVLPAVGAALLLAFLCYWYAYGLIHSALDGIASEEELRLVVKGQKIKLMLLGAALVVLTFTPLIGLLGPAASGASVCHFVLRRLALVRAVAPGAAYRAAAYNVDN